MAFEELEKQRLDQDFAVLNTLGRYELVKLERRYNAVKYRFRDRKIHVDIEDRLDMIRRFIRKFDHVG